MKYLSTIASLAILFALAATISCEVPELTKDNIQEFISSHTNPFIYFYDHPQSRSEKRKMEEFLSLENKELPFEVSLAKINASAIPKFLAKSLEIKEYKIPMISLYTKERRVDYNGGISADNMVSWIKRNLKAPALNSKLLKTKEELDELFKKNKHSTVFLYHGTSHNDAYPLLQNFSDTCFKKFIEDTKCAHSTNETLLEQYGVESHQIGFVIKNKHENDNERQDITGKFEIHLDNMHIIAQAIKENQGKLLEVYNKNMAKELKRYTEKPIMVFFMSNKNDQKQKELFWEYKNATQELKRDFRMFYTTNKDKNSLAEFEKYDGITQEKDYPSIYIFDRANFKRYKLEQPFTRQDIIDWVQRFKRHELVAIYKSGPQIEEQNPLNPAFVASASTFNASVIENNKDVVVFFRSEECNCSDTIRVFRETAFRFKNVQDIKFVEIDSRENEIPGVPANFEKPVFRYFQAGKKDVTPAKIKNVVDGDDFVEKIRDLITFEWSPIRQALDVKREIEALEEYERKIQEEKEEAERKKKEEEEREKEEKKKKREEDRKKRQEEKKKKEEEKKRKEAEEKGEKYESGEKHENSEGSQAHVETDL